MLMVLERFIKRFLAQIKPRIGYQSIWFVPNAVKLAQLMLRVLRMIKFILNAGKIMLFGPKVAATKDGVRPTKAGLNFLIKWNGRPSGKFLALTLKVRARTTTLLVVRGILPELSLRKF